MVYYLPIRANRRVRPEGVLWWGWPTTTDKGGGMIHGQDARESKGFVVGGVQPVGGKPAGCRRYGSRAGSPCHKGFCGGHGSPCGGGA
jgi:hypothetical protein